MKKAAHRQGSSASRPVRCAVSCLPLSHLRHEVAHGLGCFILLLAGGVGVGAEGEPGVVVPQHGRDRLDVHAVLEGQGGEGVPEIVEPEMLQAGILEDALVQCGDGIRAVHGQVREEGKSQGVLGVPLDKQIHCLLGDGNQLKGVFALCLCCDETGCSGLRSDSVLSENRAKFIRGGSRRGIRLQKTMRDNKRKSFLYFLGESMTTMACLLT